MSAAIDTETEMVAVATETVTPIPTLDEVIALIQRDALKNHMLIDDATAIYIDEMFAAVAKKVRNAPFAKVYILNDEDMETAHPVLDRIMVDDAVAEPGSAHEALNLRHLQDSELTFVHTFAESRGITDRYCAVVLAIDTTAA